MNMEEYCFKNLWLKRLHCIEKTNISYRRFYENELCLPVKCLHIGGFVTENIVYIHFLKSRYLMFFSYSALPPVGRPKFLLQDSISS